MIPAHRIKLVLLQSTTVEKPCSQLFKSKLLVKKESAQVSLIRNSVAKDLKLKGKDANVTITKVGGEEEEIHTKLYKVPLLSLENNSVTLHYITYFIDIPNRVFQ
jgi:hypothetical protein